MTTESHRTRCEHGVRYPHECKNCIFGEPLVERVPLMAGPTRSDLERLLWSDPATEAWQGNADKILARDRRAAFWMTPRQIDGPTGPIRELLRVVSSEANGYREQDLGDTDDLRVMSGGMKWLAILLLRGAWAAERAALALDDEWYSRNGLTASEAT